MGTPSHYQIAVLVVSLLSFAGCPWAGAVSGTQTTSEDLGFNHLFEDHIDSVYPARCIALPPQTPKFLEGTFIVQSIAQYGMGGARVEAWLDGFAKLHAFELSGGRACYKSKMIATSFRERCIAANTLSPAIYLGDTVPPRRCPFPFIGGLCNVMVPDDHTNFAATGRIGDAEHGFVYTLFTDTSVQLDFDPVTLDVIGPRKWEDKLSSMLKLGTTHLMCEVGTTDPRTLACKGPQYGLVWGPLRTLYLYRIFNSDIHTRKVVAEIPVPHIPLIHSFGLTEDYAIIVVQPVTPDMWTIVKGGSIVDSIRKTGQESVIKLVSLKDGSVRDYTYPQAIYYLHFVNSWQNSTHVTFQLCGFKDFGMGPDNPMMFVDKLTNKTERDAITDTIVLQTFTLELRDGGAVALIPPAETNVFLDFPKINPIFQGFKTCITYVVEWKRNAREYGSMALRKHNFCTGEVRVNHFASHYPSEGIFVPDGGPREDDGVVVFTRSSGLNQSTALVVLSAATMEPIVEIPAPQFLTWTAHSNFYPGLVSSSAAPRAPDSAPTFV